MQFIKDISDVGKTRKFWVGLVGAVAIAIVQYLTEVKELAPLVGLLTAFSVFQTPNEG